MVSVTPQLALPFGIDIALTQGDTSLPIRVADGGESQFSFGGQTEPLAGIELGDRGNDGVVLVQELADSLLADGQTYDDLIGQELSLIVQLPRGETETFPSEIIGVRDGFGGRTIDLGLAEREAILAWWFNAPDILQTEGYDGLTVQTTSLGRLRPFPPKSKSSACKPNRWKQS